MLPLTVRSLGTEGRKKDGQQIPPGGKVYEYILFRRSEIKDLQVKSSPHVQPTPQFNNDPATIQSHYPHPVTASTSLPSMVSASLADHNSHATHLGNLGSNFQGPSPLYQPEGNIESWGTSPSAPNANGGGLTMAIDLQGYYAAPNGIPHLHHQPLLPPPLGCSIPPSFQQPMQYSDFSPSLLTGFSNLPELPSSLLPVSSSTPSLTSASLPLSNLSPESSAFPQDPSTSSHAPPAKLASETLPVSLTNKAPNLSLPAVPLAANFPSPSALTNSGSDINAIVRPLSIKPNALYCSSSTYETVPQLCLAIAGSSNSISTETRAPSPVTPGQLLQPVPAVVSSDQHLQTPHKDVEVVQVSSRSSPEPSLPVFAENQLPILPLAVTSWPCHMYFRPGGVPIQTHHGYSAYRRGTGVWHPDPKFMAKKEKFKKDEVPGHLGKNHMSHSKEKDEEENAFIEDGDAFFDSLSSDALDQASQNGRTEYSEQIKNDTETIGDLVSHPGGRGGRSPFHGGRGGRDPSNGGRGGSDPSNGGRGGRGPSNGGRGGSDPSNGGRGGRGPSNGGRGGRGPSDGGRGGRDPSNGGRGGRGPSNGGRGGRGPSGGGRGGRGPSDGGKGGRGPSDGGEGGRGPSGGGSSDGGRGGHGPSNGGGKGGRGPSNGGGKGGRGPSNGGRGGHGPSTDGRGAPPSRGGRGGRGPSRGGRGGHGPSHGGRGSNGAFGGSSMPSHSS
ncbi:hypothetical protein Lal_00030874 [Lupinus albus]|uniref:Putative LSM domain-containing protein n=1 Tax=Lupinus albus TaxID=3870 RepID=A0A6A4P9X7_LUPAL|nr:putative LSM domain-containing protein [Lupinus albus]KAF1863771.1 hypothetical protein Lal_00030874 [Lupinus albus]